MNFLHIIFSLAILLLAALTTSSGVEQKEVVVIAGHDARLPCDWIWKYFDGMLIFVLVNGQRILYWKNEDMKEVGDRTFLRRRKILVESKKKPKHFNMSIVVPKVTPADSGLTLSCEVYSDGGLGEKVQEQSHKLVVVEPPKIISKLSSLSMIRGSKARDVRVDCVASGTVSTITWRKKDGTAISNKTSESLCQQQRLSKDRQVLILKAPIRMLHDSVYVCEAAPLARYAKLPGMKKAKKEFKFSVYFKPELKFEKSIVHTDLGVKEAFTIVASGNPKPIVTCDILKIPEPKFIRFIPEEGHRVSYELTIETVKEKDIRQYSCNASNQVGSVNDIVSLTLNPSMPKILSQKTTPYSDYYQLHWEVKSKSPITNVSVEVHVRNKDKTGKERTQLMRTDVIQLDDGDRRAFFHHVANLTKNTVHELRLKACNVRGCSKQTPGHSFKTQEYDGMNTVNPSILVEAITVAPASAIRPKGSASTSAPWIAAPALAFLSTVVLGHRL